MLPRVLFALVCFSFIIGIYCEGHRYSVGEDITVWVDRVGPFNNPQEFYMYHNLPFCRPAEAKGKLEGLGESIAGYELRRSAISISFAVPTRSGLVCEKTLSFEEAAIFAYVVDNQYWYQMFIDDLPVWGLVGEIVETNNQKMLYVYSHIHFDISKNGDQVIAASLTSESAVLIQEGAEISFTYSVAWTNTETKFSHRFENYLDTNFYENQIHWFSLFNSFMLLVFLLGLVGMIILRTIRKEYVPLGEEDPDDDITDEAGWKLLHRDVFRTPSRLVLFSSINGVGFQLIASSFLVLTLGSLGAHYYESRGAIISAFIAWYILCSFIGGYFSGSIYAKNKGAKWIKNAFITTLVLPLVLLLIVIVSNVSAKMHGSLSYIPFGTLVVIAIMWIIFCIPISLTGTFFGRHLGKSAMQGQQISVNQVPRLVPERPWYHKWWAVLMWSGMAPFSTIFVELFFVYTSVFHYKFYYMYGFMEIIFCLLLLVTMAINVIVTYFVLNNEDHHWHWTSFKIGSSVSLYVFGYSMYYYMYRSSMTGSLQFVHFACMNLTLSVLIGLMCTAAGFFASNIFVNRIYRGLKVD